MVELQSPIHNTFPGVSLSFPQTHWNAFYSNLIVDQCSQGLGKCLDDHPTELEVLTYPDLPAGAMYNADLQCRLQFNTTDETVRVCSKMDEICTQLWCLVNDECITQLRPAASGTNCGRHRVGTDFFQDLWKHSWSKWFTRILLVIDFSGARARNAFRSKINHRQSMANGVTGLNTRNVHVHAAVVFLYLGESVTIPGMPFENPI